jgi:hypothetical protein
MKPFEILIRRVKRDLTKAGTSLTTFPRIATRILEDFEYDWSKDQLDSALSDWFLKSGELPEQVSLHNTFGQPPISLFNNGNVVIDLYLWVGCDTAIHSHGFRGAFRVLHGKSLHEAFKVKVSRRIAPGVMTFEPGIPERAILEAGDVRTILPGEKLTHRVIHLENPTVTLCVKTINEPDLYQWEYHANGLALQRRHPSPDSIKKIYYYQYLTGQNPALAAPFLHSVIGDLSVIARMNLLEEISGGGLDLSEDTVDDFRAQIRAFHGREPWFQQYESAAPLYLKDLYFEGCESPVERLAAHLINGGCDRETMAPLLSQVIDRAFTANDARDVAIALMDFEPIFGCDLSEDDRATIRGLIAIPTGKIPKFLQPFTQIEKMRAFIQSFGRPT